MKKEKLYLLVFYLFLSISVNSIGLDLINFTEIHGIDSVENDLLEVINNEAHLSTYIPEQYWTSQRTKQYYSTKILHVINQLNDTSQTNLNQDYYLLIGILYYYLYNLDYPNSYDKALESLNTIESFPERDYRYRWFRGVVYSSSAKPFDAINDFEYIAERIPENSLHPLFWQDYGRAAFLAFMPKRAMQYYKLYSQHMNITLEENKIYNDLKSRFVKLNPSEFIKKENLYEIYERETGFGFISYPLGIWVPINRDWNINLLDYKEKFSGIICYSPPISANENRSTRYTINTFLYVDTDEVVRNFLNLFASYQKIKLNGLDAYFEFYEFKDPGKYKEFGGAHGIVAFYKDTEYTRSIEQPSKVHIDEATEPLFYQLPEKIISRLSSDIKYVFLLDSCEAIFEKSKNDYVDFLERVIIE